MKRTVAPATVTALEPAETMSVGRDDFERLRAVDPPSTDVRRGTCLRSATSLRPRHGDAVRTGRDTRTAQAACSGRALGRRPPRADSALHPGRPGRHCWNDPPHCQPTLRQAEVAGLLVLGRGRIELTDPIGLRARGHRRSDRKCVGDFIASVCADTDAVGLTVHADLSSQHKRARPRRTAMAAKAIQKTVGTALAGILCSSAAQPLHLRLRHPARSRHLHCRVHGRRPHSHSPREPVQGPRGSAPRRGC